MNKHEIALNKIIENAKLNKYPHICWREYGQKKGFLKWLPNGNPRYKNNNL